MENLWEQKWNEDIECLKNTLIKKHANLFFNISREEFEGKVEALKKEINNLEYDDMKIELSRLVASVGDAHTAIAFPINRYLPIKFYYFNGSTEGGIKEELNASIKCDINTSVKGHSEKLTKEGFYITKVISGLECLLYKRVDAIEGMEIEDVIKELCQIISHENEYLLKAQVVKYLQAADVLYGLYLCENKEKIKLTVEGQEIELETVRASELDYVEVDKLPIYVKNSNQNYWFERVNNDELYIKYNSCREDGIKNIKEKIDATIAVIKENNISKLTIDLRNNLGGDSTLLAPLIEFIKNNKNINTRENLKVIIGRETFSSALLNAFEFKMHTNAEIIGEPSGGKPNCYGEILRFTLPNSKFNVSYSTRYFKLIEDNKVKALYPDRYVYESIDEFK